MIERVIFALALLIIGYAIYRLHNAAHKRRTSEIAVTDPILSQTRSGASVIVYFTTPTCIPCKTVQQPTLARLQGEMGDALQVVRIDTTERPADANRWGVMSAPTTFVIDSHGKTRAVNHGVADYATLKRQLQHSA
jgi:thiol-disulfide isomerase/thioredoxin